MTIVPETFLENAGQRTGVYLLVSNDTQLLIPEARKFTDRLNPMLPQDAVMNTLVLFPKENTYTTDEIRDFILFEAKVPVNTKAKTLILHRVEFLTEKQADILLKTIEEPHSFSLIVMTASDEASVLDTVVSRAMVFRRHDPGDPVPMTYQMFRQMAEAGDVKKATEGISGAGVSFFIGALLASASSDADTWIARQAQRLCKTNISDWQIALFMARAFYTAAHNMDSLNTFIGASDD